MFVDKKPVLYVWRPFYRYFIVGVLWPILARVRRHVFAEATHRLDELSRRTSAIEAQLAALQLHLDSESARTARRFHAVDDKLQTFLCRLDRADAETIRRWNAIETLLLSVLSERAGCMEERDFR